MGTLSNSELVAVWERGVNEHPVDRALTLLSAFSSDSREELAHLNIGARDVRLLEMYQHLFGPALPAFAHCPACSELLEYTLSTHELLKISAPASDPAALAIRRGGLSMRLRLLDSLDLRAIVTCGDHESALRLLSERCVVEATLDGSPVMPADLTPQMIETVSSALQAADPRAEMLIDLSCAACSHTWQVTLDIERFLWTKVCATAKRLLRDVHTLASAYGWDESDILSLSSVRRQIYVEMACPTF
jgi:hypothetical protein